MKGRRLYEKDISFTSRFWRNSSSCKVLSTLKSSIRILRPKYEQAMKKTRKIHPFFIKKPVQKKSSLFGTHALLGAVSGLAIILCVAAGAADLLQGHIRVDQNQIENAAVQPSQEIEKARPSVAVPSSITNSVYVPPNTAENLVDKYGSAANSPGVAMAIKNIQSMTPPGAKAAADSEEALEHGYMKPSTDQMLVLMHGYVLPGMSQEQAAMLYRNLPHLPRVSESMTPERMAREPIDPLLQSQGLSRSQIEAADQNMLEEYTRERFGPIYIPPLHRDHTWLAQHAQKTQNGFKLARENQISPISAQYAYDGGQGSISEMTNSSGNIVAQYTYDAYGKLTKTQGSQSSDFEYEGYYYHIPSGFSLTTTRAYNSYLGGFISRDPIDDYTFAMLPRSPEPNIPKIALGRVSSQIVSSNLSPRLTIRQAMNNSLMQLPVRPSPLIAFKDRYQTNLYAYVNNDPINNSDPLGLICHPSDPNNDPYACLAGCVAQLAKMLESAKGNSAAEAAAWRWFYEDCLPSCEK
jgi:RHS repeat-associated protein